MQTRIRHNFGMAKPEGYRKSQRVMKLASKLNLPLICFIDTSGAYPGKDAEERGQAEAIAKCIQKSLEITVPSISIITGEGGSGGAVALAVANNTLMLEHAIYSVISPEGCSSILWRNSENADQAAEALKLTAQDMEKFKIIDEIIPEPIGGAHRDPIITIKSIGDVIERRLNELMVLGKDELLKLKEKKYLEIG